jgi:hypothetical protein
VDTLAGVTPAQFWAGPQHQAHPHAPAGFPAQAHAHDSTISLVLAIHAEADRALGFDQGRSCRF